MVMESKTLYDLFIESTQRHADQPFLGHRPRASEPHVWQTYDQVKTKVHAVAAGLESLGISAGDHVGLYAANCPEWIVAEQACFAVGAVVVPLYDTLNDTSLRHILDETKMKTCFTTGNKMARLLGLEPRYLRRIIIMDDVAFNVLYAHVRTTWHQMSEFVSPSVTNDEPVRHELATITYTSGTSNLPKGVLLTHSNIIAVITAITDGAGNGKYPQMTSEDIHYSYLPLAHVLERAVMYYMTMHGAAIAFRHPDVEFVQDIQAVRPTCFIGVPRVYQRLYDMTMKRIAEASCCKRKLYNYAYAAKLKRMRGGRGDKHRFWDRFVFRTVRDVLGGRVCFMLTGSAPIQPHVLEWLRVCFSCNVHHGYGLTETSAVISLSGDHDTTSVGEPLNCCEVKLVHGNNIVDGRGEICVRGRQVSGGYFNRKDDDAFDDQGWFHTRDIGEWDEHGRLVVIDRLNGIVKLAQGEFVHVERIEHVYAQMDAVNQIYVHADPQQSRLVAIVVPDRTELEKWAQQQSLDEDYRQLCSGRALEQRMLTRLKHCGRDAGLHGFEQVHAVRLTADEFTVDNDLLTPTYKLKRFVARQRFADDIQSMYEQLQGVVRK